jgi:hypothetical protein
MTREDEVIAGTLDILPNGLYWHFHLAVRVISREVKLIFCNFSVATEDFSENQN